MIPPPTIATSYTICSLETPGLEILAVEVSEKQRREFNKLILNRLCLWQCTQVKVVRKKTFRAAMFYCLPSTRPLFDCMKIVRTITMSRNRHNSKSLCPSRPRYSLLVTLSLKMASVSEFVPVRRELIKNTPPKPFLIGVAGGSASGKVKVAKFSFCHITVKKGVLKRLFLRGQPVYIFLTQDLICSWSQRLKT